MSSKTLSEHFEEYTQIDYYVGVYRNKDVRTFNYDIASNDPNLIGITSHINFIQVENSVDFSFRIAQINIRDTLDLRKSLPLTGNEIIYLEYNNSATSKVTTAIRRKGFFRVIGTKESTDEMSSSDPSGRHKVRNVSLYLAEYPYFDLLTFNRSKKTYKWGGGTLILPPSGQLPISSLVNSMFTDVTNRETTTNMGISYYGDLTSDILPKNRINYYSPNWSVLKNINFLKRMASTQIGNYPYYYLNCEGNRINFTSIYSNYLAKTRKLGKVEFVSQELYNLLPMVDISPGDPSDTLIDVSYDIGNVIDAVFSGFSGETKFTFDYLSGHAFNSYDYRMFKNLSSKNDLFYLNFTKFGDQQSSMTYSPFTNSKINENIQRYEYSKKSFNSMVATATTYINSNRYLGQLAHIITPSSSEQTKTFIDPIYGENWCIWGYKDIIVAGKGISKITLKKDTTSVAYFGLGSSMLPGV